MARGRGKSSAGCFRGGGNELRDRRREAKILEQVGVAWGGKDMCIGKGERRIIIGTQVCSIISQLKIFELALCDADTAATLLRGGDSVSGSRSGTALVASSASTAAAPSSSASPPGSSSPHPSSGASHMRKWRKERRSVAAASAKAAAGVETRLPSVGTTAAAAAKLFLLVPLSVRGGGAPAATVRNGDARGKPPTEAPSIQKENIGTRGHHVLWDSYGKKLCVCDAESPVKCAGDDVTSDEEMPENCSSYDGSQRPSESESPLDMTQPRDGRSASESSSSPPPQYQRPSVITCAPGAGRLNLPQSTSPSFSSSPPPASAPISPKSSSSIPGKIKAEESDEENAKPGHRREMISGDSCDPVIDEHFRRSLGSDYVHLFSPKGSSCSSSSSSSGTAASGNGRGSWDNGNSVTITGMSVDDHFAKALGETWLKLQAAEMTKEGKSGNSSDREPSPPSKCSAPTSQQQRRGQVWCPPIEGMRQTQSPAHPNDGAWQHCGKHQPCGKLLH
ncbi:hypothetical protein J437_LFUL006281 [Ladona fulva]|uniref:Transcription cofactor vestigial-like protein 4 n=1 Tax=Ladona fulva TaxID=123851 RepID=A0A8K0JZR6_LADFU|nr:hypothetical protein J437_LFUL006281 [Ladona fulva]